MKRWGILLFIFLVGCIETQPKIPCSSEVKKIDVDSIFRSAASFNTDSLLRKNQQDFTAQKYVLLDSISYCNVKLIQDPEYNGNMISLCYSLGDSIHTILITDSLPGYMYAIYPEKIAHIKKIQLNNLGRDEIVIFVNGYFERNNGADFRGEEEDDYYVFDMDENKVIFSGRNGKGYLVNSLDTAGSENDINYQCNYKIHLMENQIVIDSLEQSDAAERDRLDHEPGKYFFRNGKFVREK
ncbi:MAG: hypothetical protein HY064_07680 [Bacteroidetes bacterium]|nr:hypothetical protein [Bacteroidota bacterium]